MDVKLLHGSMIASQDETGTWIYKADPNAPFKRNGSLRQPYKDMPKFKAIIQAEKKFMADYNASLAASVIEMARTLASFGH